MWVRLTDASLLAHAVGLIALGILILWAASKVHGRGYWRTWPPAVLALWGISEIADGIVYLRRWLSQVTGWEFIRYDGPFSFGINVISGMLVALLLWRVWRGDVPKKGDQAS